MVNLFTFFTYFFSASLSKLCLQPQPTGNTGDLFKFVFWSIIWVGCCAGKWTIIGLSWALLQDAGFWSTRLTGALAARPASWDILQFDVLLADITVGALGSLGSSSSPLLVLGVIPWPCFTDLTPWEGHPRTVTQLVPRSHWFYILQSG